MNLPTALLKGYNIPIKQIFDFPHFVILKMAKRLSLIPLIILVLSTYSAILFAKTEAMFSPKGEISKNIVNIINSSKNSIDIAVFIFTSGDIAEALLHAKNRNVKIRIVIDKKQGKKDHPILQFLNDEGFNIKYVKGNVGGFMHNTFSIFDSKLVLTGSYNWTDHSENYNYENVVLIDEPYVINKFQNEFNDLFKKNIKDSKEVGNILDHNNIALTSEQDNNLNKKNITHKGVKPDIKKKKNSKLDIELSEKDKNIKLPENYLNISFEEFDDLFGDETKLGKEEKKKLWNNKFKDRYVKWTGIVRYKGISLYDWNKVGISHKNHSEADVLIKFDWTKKLDVKMLKTGTTITYLGRLESLKGFSATYKVVDCEIIK